MFQPDTGWDPLLIVGQIIALQSFFYFALGFFIWVFSGAYASAFTIDHVFNWQYINFATQPAWMLVVANIAAAAAGAAALRVLVCRAKKCWDFAITCYIWHFVFCCWRGGLPRNSAWWLTNAAGMACMWLLGEYLCMLAELQDIPIGQRPGARAGGQPQGQMERCGSVSSLLGTPSMTPASSSDHFQTLGVFTTANGSSSIEMTEPRGAFRSNHVGSSSKDDRKAKHGFAPFRTSV